MFDVKDAFTVSPQSLQHFVIAITNAMFVTHRSDSGLFGPLYENMTSYTKPEVHNVSHCRQTRTETEPRPQVTCTENFVKFGRVIFETCERIDRQTDKQTDKLTDTLIAIL